MRRMAGRPDPTVRSGFCRMDPLGSARGLLCPLTGAGALRAP